MKRGRQTNTTKGSLYLKPHSVLGKTRKKGQKETYGKKGVSGIQRRRLGEKSLCR